MNDKKSNALITFKGIKYWILIFFLFFPLALFSQLKATLTFSQSLARDWKQGETQSFELNHSLNFSKVFRLDTLRLNVAVRWAIGVQYFKAENIGQPYILPTDNELFAEGTLRYPRGWPFAPTIIPQTSDVCKTSDVFLQIELMLFSFQ